MASGIGTSKVRSSRFALRAFARHAALGQRYAPRPGASQIDADLALGAAHDPHKLALGTLGITAHATAHRYFLLLLLLQLADLISLTCIECKVKS